MNNNNGRSSSSSSITCCLIENGRRCVKVASTHNFSKRMEKLVIQKKINIVPDRNVSHVNICSAHRRTLAPPSTSSRSVQRKRRDSDSDDEQTSSGGVSKSRVRLHLLPAATLRRYKKFFKVQTKPGLNKQQLAERLFEHFKTIPANEKDILTYFIYSVKTNKNKFEQKPIQ